MSDFFFFMNDDFSSLYIHIYISIIDEDGGGGAESTGPEPHGERGQTARSVDLPGTVICLILFIFQKYFIFEYFSIA